LLVDLQGWQRMTEREKKGGGGGRLLLFCYTCPASCHTRDARERVYASCAVRFMYDGEEYHVKVDRRRVGQQGLSTTEDFGEQYEQHEGHHASWLVDFKLFNVYCTFYVKRASSSSWEMIKFGLSTGHQQGSLDQSFNTSATPRCLYNFLASLLFLAQ
jgi:hypothetical protein